MGHHFLPHIVLDHKSREKIQAFDAVKKIPDRNVLDFQTLQIIIQPFQIPFG